MAANILIWLALLILAIVVLLFLAVLLFGLRYELVKQEERLVLYRFGRFSRIGGPGYVFYSTRFETIERRINVREENKKVSVDGLFINGIPFGYTFDIWMRNDPQAAAQQSGQPLAELAQFDDRERLAQTKVTIRNALLESLAQVEQEHPVSAKAPFVTKLLPIFPGQPAFNSLMDQVRQRLSQSLPEIGVLPAPGRPITVMYINLNQQIIDGFNQGRSITLLREALPDLKSDQLLEMVAKINGIDLNYQRVQLNRTRGAEGDIDVFMDDPDTGLRTRVHDYQPAQSSVRSSDEYSSHAERHAEPANATSNQQESAGESTTKSEQPSTSQTQPKPSDDSTQDHQVHVAIPVTRITASDWSVLKRLPRTG
ncbi:MAG: hypothetical protein U0175_36805 [Caldilineaceae bacterium]